MSAVASRSGRYVIHHAGAPCGEERWTLERGAAGEVATGEQVMRSPFPFPSRLEWRAALDGAGRVASVEARWSVGERVVVARHAAVEGLWRARIEHMGQVREQEGDYPATAHVVMHSHLFHAFAFRALAPAPGSEHVFPMLAIGPPWLAVEPGRLVVRCTGCERVAGPAGEVRARRIEVLDPARGRAEAFSAWIDDDGLVLVSREGGHDERPWMTLAELAGA